ncbi:hypothetical protein [Streptomyces sp. NPDC093089]|uniref:hypothetical protein n=1 Tax=Streptomyces sp. NPDC093089 TaxID=3366024 RepID=UPI0037F60596
MNGITYVRGDATAPHGKGVKIVAHVCNDLGGWGKGFVVAVSRRWPEPEGGSWAKVEPLVLRRLVDRGIPVTVYDFGG